MTAVADGAPSDAGHLEVGSALRSFQSLHDPEIIKSAEDKKLYRVITLSNGLSAVLIHDPEIATLAEGGEKPGAALSDGHKGGRGGQEGDEEEEEEEGEEGDESDWETESEEGGEGGEGATGGDVDGGRRASLRSSTREGAANKQGAGGEKTGGAPRGGASSAKKKGFVVGGKGGGFSRSSALLDDINDDDDDDDEDDEDYEDGDEDEEDDDEDDDDEDSDEDEDEGGARRPGFMGATKKAAAAMCVGVGSFSDPLEAQGLAHFLEHMLFMGSKKFPDENDYDAFLTKHGGSTNAFTETEYTCFHFDVNHGFLQPALDRFAQFFIAPLAKPEALDREIQSVHSEFNQVLQSDSCRLMQLQCHTAHPEHPFHKFSWGNKKSLSEEAAKNGVDMRAQLMDLYLKHYRGGSMKLAVLGGEPLDVLEAWVTELFGEVRAGGDGRVRFAPGVPLWGEGPGQGEGVEGQEQGARRAFMVESVKEQHLLTLSWPLPCLDEEYEKKPQDYISHLIGHEGAGSILALLKEKGWASQLSAGVGEGGYERNSALYLFSMEINLSEAGLEHRDDVIALVYEYVAMLRQLAPQDWVFKELQAMAQMEFRFAEEESADDYAVRLCTNMLNYPKEHIVFGDYIYSQWDPALISRVLNCLTPGNMRVDLVTKPFDVAAAGVQREPWFGVPYLEQPLPAELLERWAHPASIDPALKLPPVNEFIPRDFSLRADGASRAGAGGGGVPASACPDNVPSGTNGHANGRGGDGGSRGVPDATHGVTPGAQNLNGAGPAGEEHASALSAGAGAAVESAPASLAPPAPPEVIFDDGRVKLWFKMDAEFRTPRANVYFALTSATGNESAGGAARMELLVKLLEDALNETVYLANVAKLETSIYVSGPRLEVKIGGFSDKLLPLAARVFASLRAFRVLPRPFEVAREDLARVYQNANAKPLKHSAYLRVNLLKERAWRVEDKLAALLASSPADVEALLPRFLGRCQVEGLVHGNLTSEEALQLVGIMKAALPQEEEGEGGERAAAAAAADSDAAEERVLRLPAGTPLLHRAGVKNKAEENSVVEVYFQGQADVGRTSIRERSLLDLLEQVCYEPLYDQLRTKEQLGYRVDCGVRVTHKVFGFCVRVQSADYSPAHLQARVAAFLLSFRTTLERMDAAEFESQRDALIQDKLKKSYSLLDESDFLWEQIWEQRYLFDARQLEAAALREISQADLLKWYDANLAAGSASVRQLTVQVWGKDKEAEEGTLPVNDKEVVLIDDVDAFKRSCEVYLSKSD